MRKIKAGEGILRIGKNGEQDALEVFFPVVKNWEGLYGAGGAWELSVQRAGDEMAYSAEIETDAEDVRWIVSDVDLSKTGEGRCELAYRIGGTIAKSKTYAFVVEKSLTGGAAIPDPVRDWKDGIEAALSEKLDRPAGGEVGDVLTKTEGGEVWKGNQIPQPDYNGIGKTPTVSVNEVTNELEYKLKNAIDIYSANVDENGKVTLKNQSNETIDPRILDWTRSAISYDYHNYGFFLPEGVGGLELVYSATGFDQTPDGKVKIKTGRFIVNRSVETVSFKELYAETPIATSTEIGGVKADAATDEDVQPVRIGGDGKLYVPKAQGGSGGTDLSLGLTSAEVGQIAKITAVDSAGKPTAWEAVDFGGGGGGSQFRFIRKVTIPEDITADTSGVNFAEQPNGGAWFGFDKDENGETFECTELLIAAYAAGNSQNQTFNVRIADAIPVYNTNGDISNQVTVGSNGKFVYSMSYSYIIDTGESISWGASFGGGGKNNVQTSAKIHHANNTGDVKISKIATFAGNNKNYGFLPGSWFVFYGK